MLPLALPSHSFSPEQKWEACKSGRESASHSGWRGGIKSFRQQGGIRLCRERPSPGQGGRLRDCLALQRSWKNSDLRQLRRRLRHAKLYLPLTADGGEFPRVPWRSRNTRPQGSGPLGKKGREWLCPRSRRVGVGKGCPLQRPRVHCRSTTFSANPEPPRNRPVVGQYFSFHSRPQTSARFVRNI